jgi:hypothetical protein
MTDKKKKQFIVFWYTKVIDNNGVAHYGKPFRTKILAETQKEAEEKAKEFGKRKVLIEAKTEETFDSSIFDKMSVVFEDVSRTMSELFNRMNKTLNT